MSAGIYNFTLEQGATYVIPMTIQQTQGGAAMDLTGFIARMELRNDYLFKQTSIVYLRLTTAPTGGIVFGPAAGQVTITITATQSWALGNAVGAPGQALYDLLLVDAAGVATRLLKGIVTIDPEVTLA